MYEKKLKLSKPFCNFIFSFRMKLYESFRKLVKLQSKQKTTKSNKYIVYLMINVEKICFKCV